MKKIRQTKKENWINLIKEIRRSFGDERLFFTFSPFKAGKMKHYSTFARDNIEHLDGWLVLMSAKIATKAIDCIVVIVRTFLPDNVTIETQEGKIEIPRKDMYHFFITNDEIVFFDERETYECQNTDAFTGERLDHEQGVVYRSSIELYNSLQKTL